MSSYLVGAKFSPLERRADSYKLLQLLPCLLQHNRNWNAFIVDFIGPLNVITYKHVSFCYVCNEKCLIYLLTCNCCHKQYAGQTGAYLWWDEIGSTAGKGIYINTLCYLGHSGFLCNVYITLIDKTDPSCPSCS